MKLNKLRAWKVREDRGRRAALRQSARACPSHRQLPLSTQVGGSVVAVLSAVVGLVVPAIVVAGRVQIIQVTCCFRCSSPCSVASNCPMSPSGISTS